jgi:arylsulfatase A-like enzyme
VNPDNRFVSALGGRTTIFCGPFFRLSLLAIWLLSAAAATAPAIGTAAERPNVILILADDLGWTDLACYGSDFYETPHLDRLARDGMRFSQNYSACTVCSPSRAALMTGKYPARLHITDWIPGAMPDNPKLLVPDWTKYLPLEEKTLAEQFKEAGYQTASIGKWHLGTEPYYPDKQGFDVNIAGTDKPQPTRYFAPWNIPTLTEGKRGDYLTDRLGDEAVAFIERSHSQPFFLYLAHFAVHTPIQAKPKMIEKYRSKLREGQTHTNAAYAAMLESLDATVGRVRSKLDELKIADRTIIVFTSDNGGRIPTTSNRPLRYGKASAYEGGVRVPLIVFWPNVTKPDSQSNTPTITMDLAMTLPSIAGLPAPDGRDLDGVDLKPVLDGSGQLAERDLFWHYPHHQHYQQGGTMPYGAVRSGDWKLIEFTNDMHVELYNIRDDISEAHDLAADRPELAAQLRERLHAWRAEVGAQMPSPNPNYDPSKPEYNPK